MSPLTLVGPPPLPDDIAERAACLSADPALFDDDNHPAVLASAREVCAGCPVIDDCRAHARAHRIGSGVWGGMSHGGRRPILSHDELVAKARRERDRPQLEPNPETGRPVQPHGTRARYERGCRCTPCHEAARTYYREHARLRAARRRDQQRTSA